MLGVGFALQMPRVTAKLWLKLADLSATTVEKKKKIIWRWGAGIRASVGRKKSSNNQS